MQTLNSPSLLLFAFFFNLHFGPLDQYMHSLRTASLFYGHKNSEGTLHKTIFWSKLLLFFFSLSLSAPTQWSSLLSEIRHIHSNLSLKKYVKVTFSRLSTTCVRGPSLRLLSTACILHPEISDPPLCPPINNEGKDRQLCSDCLCFGIMTSRIQIWRHRQLPVIDIDTRG